MEFIETKVFTRRLLELMDDNQYAGIQKDLMEFPVQGEALTGGSGIRKLRYGMRNRARHERVMEIYFFVYDDDHIFMLTIRSKADRNYSTSEEIATLNELVKELKL